MKEKVECNENNLIWLADENDSDIIYTSKLVVTDEDKYGELISYLKDYSNFVLASKYTSLCLFPLPSTTHDLSSKLISFLFILTISPTLIPVNNINLNARR